MFADVEEELVELSLNSVVGLTAPKTMKLQGQVGGCEVIILIDSGATHNFIACDLVKGLGLAVDRTGGYGVVIGTGLSVKGEGICRWVAVSMQGIEVIEDFLPLELGSSDLILGVQWLETLGVMMVNWKTLLMKFSLGGCSVSLKGDPGLNKVSVTLKAPMRALKHDGQGIWVELNNVGMSTQEEVRGVPEGLQRVL
ncbi:uncharacterized protein LOC112093161 [Morus notabilis]|uniref:uncharacterized protein LOC112093161 n=1 Tax=Morus notabilis TaxID=981085 RepID=UPI000CED2C1B|nr:uncharacterized protein LOC112093161 [Morus notabilis]